MMTGILLIQGAAAEPIRLECNGEINLINGDGQASSAHVILLTIDLRARTVTVDDYESVAILGREDAETIAFIAEPKSHIGVSMGFVNRITGRASIHIVAREGVCECVFF